jgi:ferredoxin
MKIPVIEASDCILCEVCTSVCPSVFHMNDLGFVDILELPKYPEIEVNNAIQNCPKDCIYWDEQ